MIKIAVIDDGISTAKFSKLEFNIEVDIRGKVSEYYHSVQDNSHGTMCATIIKKYAPDSLIGSIKILKSYTKQGYVCQLKKAIEWCIQTNISLINISLGSTQSYDYPVLFKCINNAYDNGIIIVAALSNKQVVTYPASFRNVVGVKTCPLLKDDMFYMNQTCNEGVDIIASSTHNIGNKISNLCNSYAAPLITAKVYQIMNEFGYRKIEDIKTLLNIRSFKKLENYNPYYYPKIGNYIFEIVENNPIDIPCIIIKTENINDKFLSYLNSKFNLEGYNTLFIISGESDMADISHQIVVKELNDNKLSYIASKYEADIIIIGYDNANSMISNITCDILFYQNLDNYKNSNISIPLYIDKSIFFELYIEDNRDRNDVEFIYHKIIEHLAT